MDQDQFRALKEGDQIRRAQIIGPEGPLMTVKHHGVDGQVYVEHSILIKEGDFDKWTMPGTRSFTIGRVIWLKESWAPNTYVVVSSLDEVIAVAIVAIPSSEAKMWELANPFVPSEVV